MITPKSNNLVFFGTEDFSAPSLEALIKAGYTVSAVVTKPDTRRGRGRELSEPLVKKVAQSHNIPVLQPTRLSEIHDELQKLTPATGILVSYGKIIPQSILDLFEPGIINIHPSKLPRYRGPSPIEAAIKNRDSKTAISIMKLTSGMDEGPIYQQKVLPLNNQQITRPALYSQLSEAGAELLIETLPDIISGKLQAKEQSTDDVSYTTLLHKSDGIINPVTDTATEIEAKIRAYLGYPKSRLPLKTGDVVITSAKVVDSLLDKEFVLPCKNDSYLMVESLIAPSGKTMSGSAYLRGLK